MCVVALDIKSGKKTRLEVTDHTRRFSIVAIDTQTITFKTKEKNIKVMVIMDAFTKFVYEVSIPDKRAKTLA